MKEKGISVLNDDYLMNLVNGKLEIHYALLKHKDVS
jgi:hypothetical protein